MSDLVRRQQATQRTLAKYRDQPFSWKNNCTCVHLARFHLLAMGHKLPRVPRVKSLLAAKRVMESNGWEDTAAMLDCFLPRISPASMLVGDIAVVRDDSGLGAVTIATGLGLSKVFGWHEEAPGLCVQEISEYVGAWRG
jgi:hypothetical protein